MDRSDDQDRVLCVYPDVSQRYDHAWIALVQRVYEGEFYVFRCGDETFKSGQWVYGTGVGGKDDCRSGRLGDAVNIWGRGKRTGDVCQLANVWGGGRKRCGGT